MSSGRTAFIIKVRMAWWWPLYLHGMALTSALSRREPDWDKVRATARRAMRVRVIPVPPERADG